MNFARLVFRGAAMWGLLILVPLFFMFGGTGTGQAPLTYPQAYFGFLAVTLAWQLAFWVIASDPVRFRPLMIPAIIEKFGYVVALGVLYGLRQVSSRELLSALPDLVLGVLFMSAYLKTPRSNGYEDDAASLLRWRY